MRPVHDISEALLNRKRACLFSEALSLIEGNPFNSYAPINCGRYYTGQHDSAEKRSIFSQIIHLMNRGDRIFLYENRQPFMEFYEWNTDIGPDMFLLARQSFESIFDIHFFSLTAEWAICLDAAEEVVALGLPQQQCERFLRLFGGEAGLLRLVGDDMSYLQSFEYWPRQEGIFIAYS